MARHLLRVFSTPEPGRFARADPPRRYLALESDS
jgi:hypothetical protein